MPVMKRAPNGQPKTNSKVRRAGDFWLTIDAFCSVSGGFVGGCDSVWWLCVPCQDLIEKKIMKDIGGMSSGAEKKAKKGHRYSIWARCIVATWLDLSPRRCQYVGDEVPRPRSEKRAIPRTTPPFQITKATKIAIIVMCGHTRLRIFVGWWIAARAILTGQRIQSGLVSKLTN